jgi:hypothetical protein
MHMLFDANELEIRSPSLLEINFNIVDIVDFEVVSTTGSTPEVIDDANTLLTTSDVVDTTVLVGWNITAGSIDALDNAVVQASNGTVEGKLVRRLADGPCTITVNTPWLSKGITRNFARTGGLQHNVFQSYIASTLAGNNHVAISSLATGKNASHLSMFSTKNHTSSTYVRNTNCWLSGINATAISPWNSLAGEQRAGVAITPRHVICVSHYPLQVGAVVRFITTANAVVERTVTDVYTVPGGFNRDTAIAKLDSDLPSSITPVKLLPSTFPDYIPTVETFHIDCIGFDQEENVLAKQLTLVDLGIVDKFVMLIEDSARYPALTQRIIGGDSGNPIFLLINSTLVLLSMWSGPLSGPALHRFIGEIDTGLTTLGGGYTVQTVSLSGFTAF